MNDNIEIVPAILKTTYEAIAEDWGKVVHIAERIHIDVTDGIFAGNPSCMDVQRFQDLRDCHKTELHMMVQAPAEYIDDIIELNPSRCIFHIEAFLGNMDLPFIYNTVGEYTSAEMGIAINPDTDSSRLTEYLPLIQYVLFMGYTPGFSGQEINPEIFNKIAAFHHAYPAIRIAVDGHVTTETIEQYATAGATIFCANTAIFGSGNPEENMAQLATLAKSKAE